MPSSSPSPFAHPAAGLLIPVFALRRPDDFGIGDTKAVMEAIDFCKRHGFEVLQTLPIHDTVGDHSPYNPISSRALSPTLLTLDLDEASVPGLTRNILQSNAPESWLVQVREGAVKHGLVHSLKLQILQHAFDQFILQNDQSLIDEFESFQKSESDWLPGYTLFRTLVGEYDNNPHWEQWRPEHQSYDSAETWLLAHPENERLHTTRRSLAYIQWVAHRQWTAVRAHADTQAIQLMGEISFGVSKSSADVWQHRELFDTDWSMGTRPVVYFDTNKDSERWGQNWGLPPYRWENHRSTNFEWLRRRVQSEAQYFHICRIDHLRGYFRAYMFPWQGGSQHSEFALLDENQAAEKTGGRMPRFVPGPDEDPTTSAMNDLQGRELISIFREAAGPMFLFAEIMGAMPDYMRTALEDLQLPSLTFPLLETNENGSINPASSYRPLSLVSYGNHDHAPIASIYQNHFIKQNLALQNLLNFAEWQSSPPDSLNEELLAALQRSLFKTPCLLAVLMIPDLLGTTLRFNLPGSYGDQTWCERLDFTLEELEHHPVYGPRIATASRLLRETGRHLTEPHVAKTNSLLAGNSPHSLLR
ncbi:4-alpha-glucanotransferase [Phragmitibacter flavus]|uniref:4-alpha-glucanotransferase n=1 Tax=Phragmitibacter flavus TaxID=2576071 RepID=A0A5R8KCL3_9BACT|nr:4-alpha-glucanotransferase [Phragmitibacter flavus]TLD70056.1 4-alpha-glucanotransferase [Phragmitibacter flavus]